MDAGPLLFLKGWQNQRGKNILAFMKGL